MTVTRRLLLALFSILIFTALAARPSPAQSATPAPTASATPANQQAYNLPPDQLAKAIAISRIRNILDIAGSVWGLVFLWLLLATRAAAGLDACVQRVSKHRWLQGLLFFAAFFLITTLAGLPLDMYGHSVERGYQISVQSWAGWFGDQVKALALAILIGSPVLLLFNWIVRRWPRRYWFGVWLVTLPILVVVMFVAPLVSPLFDKFEPLSKNHPALVQELEKIVARTGTNIPPGRMYLMQASAKTNGLNAYVIGIGATKRIVVWDTTAGRIPDDEVLFIFAHESGHYVLHHIPKGLALSAVGLFFIYWACSTFAAWLANRFAVSWGLFKPDQFEEPHSLLASRTGFVVLLFTISVVGFLLQPVSNAVSRHFEHQADVYGQEAMHGIVPDPQKTAVAAFNDLGKAWLEDPNPSPLIEFWLYDHPSTEHRAEFALHYNPWANGGHGEFFAR